MMDMLKNKYVLWGAIGLIVVIAISVTGVLRARDGEKLELTSDGGPVREAFNAKSEARAIYDSLVTTSTLATEQSEGFNRILNYTDNELRLVHEEYIKMYKGDQLSNLRKLINAEWTMWPANYSLKKQVLQRLTKIGI